MLFTGKSPNISLLYDRLIAENGVVVAGPQATDCHYLYTIGNTAHRCPELLIVCHDSRALEYRDLLTDFSVLMQKTGKIPDLHKPFSFARHTFSCVEVDRVYIAYFAETLLTYYNHAPMRVLQLLTRDHHGRFPFEPTYARSALYQPLFKSN